MVQGIFHGWSTTLSPLDYVSLTCLSNFCFGSLALKGELENSGEIGCLKMLVCGERGVLPNPVIYAHYVIRECTLKQKLLSKYNSEDH